MEEFAKLVKEPESRYSWNWFRHSPDHDLPLSAVEVPSPGKPGYTLFVPRDDAFWRLFVQDATAPDPFILDDEFRLQTLLNHVAVGRFFSFDLEDGDEITTVGGKTLTGSCNVYHF